jgi:high affinity sulfate transporter 1
MPRLYTWIPGLRLFENYQRSTFRYDLVAGVSVAAVAIPIGIAYAQLAGSPPAVGIYSCIAPPVAYAVFGSSRQLIVNPDAAACAIVAATALPLAAGDASRYADLSVALTLMVGVLCIIAGFFHLGVIANFLSRPILVGYLNGIAVSIIAGQIGKLIGVDIPSGGVFKTIGRVAVRLKDTHWPTLFVGVALIALLLAIKRYAPRLPGPLIACVFAIVLVFLLHLNQGGMHVVGAIPAGFLLPRIPQVAGSDVVPLVLGSCTIVLVSFCSMMTTARGFATKNGYQIDANRDLVALGACDIASGLSHGFVVSGADSRTAVADASGGKTQVTSLVAAATMAFALLFLTGPLAYLPSAALAAILITSAIGLFDVASLRRYYRTSRPEFRHLVVAMLGVMTVGILSGIVVAVGLALLRLLKLASKPHDAVLGKTPGKEGFYSPVEDGNVETTPGLIIYRFNASIVFFNSDYFLDRVRKVIAEAKERPRWFLFDAEAAPFLDITGAEVLESIRKELEQMGIVFCVARARDRFVVMVERTEFADRIGREHIFPTLGAGHAAFQRHIAAEQEQRESRT